MIDPALWKKYFFVIEACEHKEHFLQLDPEYTIITNMTYDHQDYFVTQEAYRGAFTQLAHKTHQKVVYDRDNQLLYQTIPKAKSMPVDISIYPMIDFVHLW